ncbi:MAG: hypothetical protein KUG59_09145 [Parvibaculaceae bacterium]|nr:hypothetical protein [Parvibaculaceae bacterium]
MSILGTEGEFVDEVIEYPVSLGKSDQAFKLFRQLRNLKCTQLVYLLPERGLLQTWRDWLFFKLVGFKTLHCFPQTFEMRKRQLDSVTGLAEREAVRLARCCEGLGEIDLQQLENWDLKLSPREIDSADETCSVLQPSPFIALNMGGKAEEKDWGFDNWVGLFEKLQAPLDTYGLLVLGAGSDHKRAEKFLKNWPGPKLNACGLFTPRESAAAVKHAQLFVGHDSGPLHLAAAMQVPCVGLFGNFNRPIEWHPFGGEVSIIHEMRGLDHIQIEHVASLILKKLGNEK